MYFLSETSWLGALVAQFSHTSLVTKSLRNHEVRKHQSWGIPKGEYDG